MSSQIVKRPNKKTDVEPAPPSLLSEFDISLFREGRHYMLYKHLGAQPFAHNGRQGILFSVWAPGANYVSVIGDFNHWDKSSHKLQPRWDSSGIWELYVPNVPAGALYKFHIGNASGSNADKADPFSFEMEMPPHTASRISAPSCFTWNDEAWMAQRDQEPITGIPLSIYEMHIGSWRRITEEGDRWMSYREVAEWLPSYCGTMGFTHVEFLPVMEHPFFGSWGYQLTGYFAPSARFGTPDDFRYLVNALHESHIGVILDWVPSHFPGDAHGLFHFDGTHLYEHADPREGYHPDWQSYIFNYGRNEVRSFLISNAIYWLAEFHIDGLRVDAVASMLYRDYSRKEGEWIPNHLGGRENLEAIYFLQQLNDAVHTLQPGTFTIAEESTAFPGVTQPIAEGGLGFDFKWMMGWMHDTLAYFHKDPVYRSFHQHQLTFSMHYAYSERFVLPLSHDEVVHGKGALIAKMPGDEWQRTANLRLLYGYMFGHPGAKLLFMGDEWGQDHEWRHDHSLSWHQLDHPFHKGISELVRDLNHLYTSEPALYQNNYSPEGFEWIDFNDTQNSVFCWMRKGKTEDDYLLFIANATPRVLRQYELGVPGERPLKERLNTDNAKYGGSDVRHADLLYPVKQPMHGRSCSVSLTLPPLALLVLQPEGSNVPIQEEQFES
ncbi:1,4-alpha-glucan branching protein GlgB [Taibaiella koreensis]|uniref:1,4-alpha-glucan branching protein GlgB n=1 Tax=Taibaiella koreensis TaxID=1268548 RepID=UPI000E59CE18|nr:1,4-alpha-glucan branching protein GlgB [Taibaiella koreensis]